MSGIYTGAEFGFDCGLYEQHLRLEGGNIDDYVKQLSTFLEEKRERVNKTASEGEVIATYSMEGMEDLVAGIVKYFNNNANKTIFNALFVMTNSYLEWGVVEICRLAGWYLKMDFKTYYQEKEKATGQKQKVKQGLEKVKDYLQNELNIPIKDTEVWRNIKFNQEIRNLFVHNAASLFKDYRKKLSEQEYYIELSKRSKDFDIIDTGFVYITNMDYIKKTHAMNTDFIYEVYSAVREEMNKKGFK